jgi:putative ABC transport system substrate-binding protein
MKRRGLLRGGLLVLAPVSIGAAFAQKRHPRLALVSAGKVFPFHYFTEALKTLGWIEGTNLMLSIHTLGTDPGERARVAAEIVAIYPDLVVAAGVSDALAVHALDNTVPIVVVTGTDLEQSGLVQSLRHPGGNVTGITTIGADLNGKRLELLRELLPDMKQAGLLGVPTYPNDSARFTAAAAQARSLSIALQRRSARTTDELDAAFAASRDGGDQAILIPYNALTYENMPQVVALAERHRLPAIFEIRDYVEAGGLISFGAVYPQYFKAAAFLADKILKGSYPGDLPVQQPLQFETVLNLGTARQLGLYVKPELRARIDELIE